MTITNRRNFSLSDSSRANREGVDYRLIEISNLAIKITLIDFGHGALAGFRTKTEQHKLFTQGVSKADGLIKISKHQEGKALDFYAFVNGKASWETHHLAMVGAAFLQASSILGYPIKWGGLWEGKGNSIYGWDMPHIELID